jgi:hypothetical protein
VAKYTGTIVDIDIHNRPASDADLAKYLPKEWRAYGEARLRHGASLGKPPTGLQTGIIDAAGRRRDAFREGEGFPGSSYGLLRELWLDKVNLFKGILTHDVGEYSMHRNADFAAAVCRAANDWMIEEWLPLDERLVAGIVPARATPQEGVKEIRRLADHPRMCCVYIAGDPLQVGMGHPVYHPIYAAAAEVGLPILVHPHHRGEIAGTPSTMTENLSSQPLRAMHDISSLIVYGVFEKYPTLKVVLTEFGFTWLPTLMANLDRSWDALRVESLWVRKRPSEYIREHIRLSTQPLEGGAAEHRALLQTVEGVDDILCFSSDYPHVSMDDVEFVARVMPDEWHRKLFCDNACDVFGWVPPQSEDSERLVAGVV